VPLEEMDLEDDDVLSKKKIHHLFAKMKQEGKIEIAKKLKGLS